MPLSGADHINAQLYRHQLGELGQSSLPAEPPFSFIHGKSSYLTELCEGIVALVTIRKIRKVGAWNKPIDQKGSTRPLGFQQPDPLKTNSPDQAWDREKPDLGGLNKPNFVK